MRRFALAASLAVVAVPAHAREFTCPPSLTVDEEVNGIKAAVEHKFRYVSFFDGDPKDLADLAPDEGPDPKQLEQNWTFERSPDRPIVMVCRYHGTDATATEPVPAEINSCVLNGEIDADGEVQGSPTLACK